jgi:hypothetical protein
VRQFIEAFKALRHAPRAMWMVIFAFVPKDGPKSSETMWLLYGLIAMLGPVSLVLARKWVRSGMAAAGA